MTCGIMRLATLQFVMKLQKCIRIGITILNFFIWGGISRVGISGTTAKSRQRKFVPSSHPGPSAAVASSRKSQTKVGTLACFDLL